MKEIVISGSHMTSIEAAHEYIARKLNFPTYYGGNLDALWDVLSTLSEPMKVTMIHLDKLHSCLGQFGEDLVNVFIEAALNNEHLHFEIN